MQQPENAAHKAPHGRRRATVLLGVFAVWLIVAGIGCSPMAVATHEGLKLVGVESEIAVGNVTDRTTYVHIFVIVDGRPYEPRFAGLLLVDNVVYNTPRDRCDSTDAYLNAGHSLIPPFLHIVPIVSEDINAAINGR